jgi:antitoxin (DNA-binding transcriptional repressor) of toxin-antitoxin stability system
MITVGVRDLKNQLSLYLQYVKNGEKIIITEHDKIIAEINVPSSKTKVSPLGAKLLHLSKNGNIILAKRNKSCVKLPKVQKKLDWEAAYNDVRADRI